MEMKDWKINENQWYFTSFYEVSPELEMMRLGMGMLNFKNKNEGSDEDEDMDEL